LNEHIYDFLKHYISLEASPQYALLLAGKWGSGKTFFINNFLEKEEKLHENVKFVKISLFGINSVDEVHKQIIFQLVGTDQGSMTDTVLKIGSNVLDHFGKKINLGLKDIPIEQILKKLPKKLDKEIVFIFDDLERISVEIPKILGYINTLIERLNYKVILLANESELAKKDVYTEFKEKVIGKTFEIAQDFENAFDTFTELSMHSKATIKANKHRIKSVFDTANYKNLRHIRQSVLDFEYFYEAIENKFRKHIELMGDLIEKFFALSIEIKHGSFDVNELKDLRTLYLKRYTSEDKDTKTKIETVLEKYPCLKERDMLLTSANWITLFSSGILSQERIAEDFNNSSYFMQQSTKEWIKLWHFMDLENEDFEDTLKVVIHKLESYEYTEHEVILHVAGILLKLSEINLYKKPKSEIVEQVKKSIDKNVDKWKNDFQIEIHSSAFSYGYFSKDTEEFVTVNTYMMEKNREAISLGLIDEGKRLLDYLEDNDLVHFDEILSSNTNGHSLWNLPVLSKIEPMVFWSILSKVENAVLRRATLTLADRYKHLNTKEDLIDELDFWKNIETIVEQELPKFENTVKGYLLMNFKDIYLKEKIIGALQKARDNKAEELIKNQQADS
jgi:hypothetical protein